MRSSVVLPAPFGPSRPVMPGAHVERHVAHGDDAAEPARHAVHANHRRSRCDDSWREPPVARTIARHSGTAATSRRSTSVTRIAAPPVARAGASSVSSLGLAEDHVVHVHRDVGEVEHRDPLARRALRSPAPARRVNGVVITNSPTRNTDGVRAPRRERGGEHRERRRVRGHREPGGQESRNVEPVLLQIRRSASGSPAGEAEEQDDLRQPRAPPASPSRNAAHRDDAGSPIR